MRFDAHRHHGTTPPSSKNPPRGPLSRRVARCSATAGFHTEDLVIEDHVAIVPRAHSLASRTELTLAEVSDVPDLPIARWPLLDGSYPPGPGPEVHTQSQLAQLVALGRTLLVIPASSRAWQWPEHVAVPVVDAPRITTVIAWPERSRSRGVASLVLAAVGLRDTQLRPRQAEGNGGIIVS